MSTIEKEIAGVCIQCNEQGYMTNMNEWNKDIASEFAKEEGIEELTAKHWEVLDYLREQCANGTPLTIRKVGKSGVVNIKEFYALFPDGPLKKAARIAGIPKPVSCI